MHDYYITCVAEARRALDSQRQAVAAAEEILAPLQARWFKYTFPSDEAPHSLQTARSSALAAVAEARAPLTRLELALQNAERTLRDAREAEADRAWLDRTEADCLETVAIAEQRLAESQRQHDLLEQTVTEASQRLAGARQAAEAVADATEHLDGLKSKRSAILGKAYAAGAPAPDTNELGDAIGDAEMHLDALARDAEAAEAAIPLLEKALEEAKLALLEDSPLARRKSEYDRALADLYCRQIRQGSAALIALRDKLATVDRSAASALTRAWKTGLLVPGPRIPVLAPGL